MTVRFRWPVLIAALGFFVVAIANVTIAAETPRSGNAGVLVADQDTATGQTKTFSATENFGDPE